MLGADSNHIIDALGWTLLDFLWQGLLIAVVYAAVRRLLGHRRANARLLAGYVALLVLAMTPVLTFVAHHGVADTTVSAASATVSGPVLQVVSTLASPARFDSWLSWLVAAWASGVLLLALHAIREWAQLRAICRDARPLRDPWQSRLDRLVPIFGARRPQLLESVRITSPLVVGWIRPVILLPAGLCLRLPAAQLELLLAHELAHIRRWDFPVNLLQIAVETVLFYHPAVHWVSRRIREDRELCCDDLVARNCDSRVDYARALLAVAEQQSPAPRMALAASAGQLLLRVERIIEVAEPRQPDRTRRPIMVPLVLGLVVLAIVALRDGQQRLPALPLPQLLVQPMQLAAPVLGFELAPTPVLQRPDLVLAPPAVVDRPPLLSSAAATGPVLPAPPAPRLALQRSAPLDPPLALEPELPTPVLATAPIVPLDLDTDSPAGVAPTHVREPEYPAFARSRGIEGEALLSYRIERGRATDIRVESESHSGTFAVAAKRALQGWRFPSGVQAGRQLQLFEFRLSEQSVERQCVAPTGSRICRPVH